MTNLYCPNCHRQLHEIDVKFKVCSMCCTPLKISEEKKDNTDCILDKIKNEIEQDALNDNEGSKFIFINRVNQIINKYKTESEGA